MIDHLTPYEGVVFGAIIALGILSMLSSEENTQMVGACLLAAGFWGGVIALVRALLHREAGSLYVLCAIGALIAGLIKYFVLAEMGQNGGNRIIWTFIIGIGLCGVIGIALNALIHKPKEEVELENESESGQSAPEETEAMTAGDTNADGDSPAENDAENSGDTANAQPDAEESAPN